jgi:polysaccharide biosynthesis transport protein
MEREALEQRLAAVLQYRTLISRHKYQVLIGSMMLLVACCLIISRLQNVYEATTTILVDPQQVPEQYVRSAVNNSDPSGRLNTITQQVLSRTRLQAIIWKFDLYSDLRSTVSEEDIIEIMRDNVKIQVRQGSGSQLSTFTITFHGKDQQLVAKVADELATSFINWNLNDREQLVSGTKDFLASELNLAKKSLELQENNLRQFKMSHLGETPDQTATNLQAIAGLTSTLQATSDSINRLEQEKLMLIRAPQTVPTAGATPEVSLTRRQRLQTQQRQLETTLQQLRERYSEAYPDVVRAKRRLEQANAELASLPADAGQPANGATHETSATAVRLELIDKELERLNAEQRRVQAKMAVYQAKVDAAPVREQQLVELSRNYDVSKQHYQSLLDKSFNIEMAASLEQKQKGERFTVLDPAKVPDKPVKPRRRLLVALAFLLSLAGPVGWIVCREALDPSIKSEPELKQLVPAGVRVIGILPTIETMLDRHRRRQIALAALAASLMLSAVVMRLLWQMRALL